jgi:hypothetical protein
MTESSGALTTLDLVHSMAFANDQVSKMKCTDPELIKQFCDGDQCLLWKNNQSMRMWPKPCKVTTTKCTSDVDCKNTFGTQECNSDGFCSYCPTDPPAGHCHIATEKACMDNSTLPYTCTKDGCTQNKDTDKDKDKKDTSYLEWRNVTCDADSPCPNPGQTCEEGKCTCTISDDCPGAATCENGKCEGNRCVLGNFLLREWCENPSSRCTKDKDGNYPAMCDGSSSKPGVTDVPPFMYNNNDGQCYMTKDYCDRYTHSYSKGVCTVDTDCATGEVCYGNPETPSAQKYCTGPGSECKISAGEEIGEMAVGKTLFHLFSNGLKCESFVQPESKTPDLKTNLMKILKQFDNTPDTITANADSKHMVSKTLTGKNFAGSGINIYLITWSEDSGVKPLVQSGFDADEVIKVFPSIVTKIHGVKHIQLKKKDIGKDSGLKRIFLTLASSQWVTSNISDAYSKREKP